MIETIGKEMFPSGSLLYSNLFIQNGEYRSAGEIVAASLAQGEPAPCFLDHVVYESLSNSEVDFTQLNTMVHLTQTKRDQIEAIKKNLDEFHDIVIEHGYTGPIKKEAINDISGSVMISIVSRRLLALREFMEGLNTYGLKDIILKSPEVCKPLFVIGQLEEADATYVASFLNPVFSHQECDERAVEEKVVDNFQDFLHNIEDKKLKGFNAAVAWNNNEEGMDGNHEGIISEEKFEEAKLSAAAVASQKYFFTWPL